MKRPLKDPQPDIRTVGRAATATCEGAVSYDLSGERLTERGLSGRPHPAPGPRTRRASAGQRYIRWFFRRYYRDPWRRPSRSATPESLERLRERAEDAVTGPAGSTALVDADIPPGSLAEASEQPGGGQSAG